MRQIKDQIVDSAYVIERCFHFLH